MDEGHSERKVPEDVCDYYQQYPELFILDGRCIVFPSEEPSAQLCPSSERGEEDEDKGSHVLCKCDQPAHIHQLL